MGWLADGPKGRPGYRTGTPQFVLKTGDLVDNGWNRTQWIAYFTASSFLHNSTLYPVLGNHEAHSILYFSFFSLPFNEHWYSFENGPIRFIGLESSKPNRYRISQYLWLSHELQTSDAPFTIVFFHHRYTVRVIMGTQHSCRCSGVHCLRDIRWIWFFPGMTITMNAVLSTM